MARAEVEKHQLSMHVASAPRLLHLETEQTGVRTGQQCGYGSKITQMGHSVAASDAVWGVTSERDGLKCPGAWAQRVQTHCLCEGSSVLRPGVHGAHGTRPMQTPWENCTLELASFRASVQ